MIESVDPANFEVDSDWDPTRTWRKSFGEGTIFDPGKYVYSIDGAPYLLHLTTKSNPFTGNSDVPLGDVDSSGDSSSSGQGKDLDGDGIPDRVENENHSQS